MPPLARRPNSPSKGLWDGAALFEDIGERPERHHVDLAVALADGVGERGSDEDGVARLHSCPAHSTRSRTAAVRHGRGFDLVADLRDGAADAVVHGNLFVRAEEIFDGVVGVAVGGDEIDGHVIFRGVLQELRNPGRGGRGGSADAQARADGSSDARAVWS